MTAPLAHEAGTTRKASQLIADVREAVTRELRAIDDIHRNVTRDDFRGTAARAFSHVIAEIMQSGGEIGKRLDAISRLVKEAGDALVSVEAEQEERIKNALRQMPASTRTYPL